MQRAIKQLLLHQIIIIIPNCGGNSTDIRQKRCSVLGRYWASGTGPSLGTKYKAITGYPVIENRYRPKHMPVRGQYHLSATCQSVPVSTGTVLRLL